ncbi:MAG: hypothetical protein RI935_213 [Candidatus Parcubacteria bacterium]|jgi:hypothetical protein
MNNNNPYNDIEKALSMYKENVSPSETSLQAILSQIPEQQNLKEGRAIRSPYRWLAFTQLITVSMIVIALLPSLSTNVSPSDTISNNPYYEVDAQVASFEEALDIEDASRLASQ